MNDPATLKPFLDRLLEKFDRSYLEPDPLAAVDFRLGPDDLEVAALFAALFAYGRADLIQRNVARILAAMGPSPSRFVESFKPAGNREWMSGFKYRFNTRADLIALVRAVGEARRRFGSLRNLFTENDDPAEETVGPAITASARALKKFSGAKNHSFDFLIANPAGGAASKRWSLYLRWMVRKDRVDPGPWEGAVDKPRLVIPLDTHVARIARRLGMLERKSNDWKAVVELTRYLRKLDPDDPVKYDFAICSYGKLGYCVSEVNPEKCRLCDLAPVCANGS